MDYRLPAGFRIAARDAGLTGGERPDLCLVVADETSPAAACFTNNKIVASPVALSREHLRQTEGCARAILVNAGCANACTGAQGDEDAMACARLVAELVACDVLEVLVFSTGVIGERLAVDKIEAALPSLFAALDTSAEAIDAASRAILTTDTRAKVVERDVELESGGAAHVLGFAKGSGMIHPDMATMLAFLLSDFAITASDGLLLRAAVTESFHRISVDGDTSTNDSVLLWASGQQPGNPTAERGWFEGLRAVSHDLAKAIVADGEGASKVIEVRVTHAQSPDQALDCARTIATSALVRTAVHGGDPNWGRIIAAAGRSKAELDTRKLRIGIGEACLFSDDEPHAENEPVAAAHLGGSEVVLWVDLGVGHSEASFWSCDLTADYIRINADYRS